MSDVENLPRALDFAAASAQAVAEVAADLQRLLEALLTELNIVRKTVLPALPDLKLEDLLPGGVKRFEARREDLFRMLQSQQPNEVKPWEAL